MDALRFKTLFGVCGCGLVLGFSALYVFLKTRRELKQEFDAINKTIAALKKEIEEIKAQSNRSPSQKQIEAKFASIDKCFQCNDLQISLPESEGTNSADDNDEEFFDFAENEPQVNCVLSNGIKNVTVGSGDQNWNKWIKEVDSLLEDTSTNKLELYNFIRTGESKFGVNSEISWRLAKATHLRSIAADKDGDKEMKRRLAFETLEHAKKAIEDNDKNAECHKWYAIAIGSIGDYVSTKEKIQNGNEFKKHVDIALELKPDDPTLHHMLGRWYTEIAKLSWVERKVASTLFSKVPEATHDMALSCFMKAYELKPKWKENVLCISNSFVAMKKFEDAIQWIDRAVAIRVKGEDDQLAHESLLELQRKFESYRN